MGRNIHLEAQIECYFSRMGGSIEGGLALYALEALAWARANLPEIPGG